jgi:hypothetical protein
VKGTPLPGQYLAVLDPQRRLIVDVYPCEDGHAQERSILPQLVEHLVPGQLWIMDRNFCTKMWLMEIALNKSFFIVRHHAGMPLETLGSKRYVGCTEKGQVYEQKAVIRDEYGEELTVRCITLRLNEPNDEGDSEIIVLTNLPDDVDAEAVIRAYAGRWTIERAFHELTLSLNGEIDTLTYPPAALLACAIAFVTYNALSVVKTAIATVHGPEKRETLSTYYMAAEVASVSEGMQIAIPGAEWKKIYERLSADQMADALKAHARHVNLKCYAKAVRGPKKPSPKRKGSKPHVSTAKLLSQRKRRT